MTVVAPSAAEYLGQSSGTRMAARTLLSALLLYGLTAQGLRGQEAASGPVTLEYVAHASFIIESPEGTRLLLDPFADRVWLGYDFPEGLEYDAVAITHPHYDHDGGEYRGMSVPWPEGTPVYRDAGRVQFGDMGLVGTPGRHADPYGKEFGQKNVIWVVEVGGLRIAHLGDNGPLTEAMVQGVLQDGPIDVLLIPVDGVEHIITFDVVAEVRAGLSPRVTVPMHYRIPELEPGDGPSDLGGIDPWLSSREGVRRLDSHVLRVAGPDDLGDDRIVVFRPSPLVVRPEAEPGGR